MDRSIVDDLEAIVGRTGVVTAREQMLDYLQDESVDSVRPKPAEDLILVKPATAQQISQILELANKHSIPVFPRGGGTGLAGGAVPTKDGLVVSMERMNKIEIDRENMMAVAEAGVTLETLLNTATQAGLFFPLHPGDESAQLGGLAATNAGGVRAVKYGVMRNYVRGIEAVLPTGEILSLGGKLHKNNVGYDFMQLLVGSEGTLAIITKVILRLLPKSPATATLILPYNNMHDAIASVSKILQVDIPLAVEYVEKDLMERSAEHLGETWPVKSGTCYLIVVVAESSKDHVLETCMKIAEACQQNKALEPLFVDEKDKQERILRVRSNIYSAMKNGIADILDITVPVSEITKVVDQIEEIAKRDKIIIPVFGHAADGNLHVHIMKTEDQVPEYAEKLKDEIYDIAAKAGGVITGEHGIGKIRTGKLQPYLAEKEIELMRQIKKILDPKNILNPGTKVPM